MNPDEVGHRGHNGRVVLIGLAFVKSVTGIQTLVVTRRFVLRRLCPLCGPRSCVASLSTAGGKRPRKKWMCWVAARSTGRWSIARDPGWHAALALRTCEGGSYPLQPLQARAPAVWTIALPRRHMATSRCLGRLAALGSLPPSSFGIAQAAITTLQHSRHLPPANDPCGRSRQKNSAPVAVGEGRR